MLRPICFLCLLLCLVVVQALGQDASKDSLQSVQDSIRHRLNLMRDTAFIREVQDVPGKPDKVLHAEPLFVDLIRDLGARKGEAEWNVAYGMTDVTSFTRYDGLIEYEFAPANRLGLEIEMPFSIHQNNLSDSTYAVPSDRINGLKTAFQYSFFVSEKYKASAALGYIHEFEFPDLDQYRRERFYKGNVYSPFLVVAKRWGNQLHSLVYTGPRWIQEFKQPQWAFEYSTNTSLHYMLSGTRNFVGIEINKNLSSNGFSTVLRPQMRLAVTDHFLIGIVTGIPTRAGKERLSTFVRLIYEPGHRRRG